MALAENRAYDYNREYLRDLPIENPQIQVVKKPRAKKRQKTHLFSILFIFALSILIISRFAYIAEVNFKINNLEKEYNKAMKEYSELNVTLMGTVNLENIEKVAVEKLHMKYPSVANQVVYVNVNQSPITVDRNTYKNYYNISDVQTNKYIAYAKNAASSIVSMLN